MGTGLSMKKVDTENQTTVEKDGLVIVTLAGLTAGGLLVSGIIDRVIILD